MYSLCGALAIFGRNLCGDLKNRGVPESNKIVIGRGTLLFRPCRHILAELRLQPASSLVLCVGLKRPPLLLIGIAQIEVGLSQVGISPQRLLVTLNRFLCGGKLAVADAQDVVELSILNPKFAGSI